MPAFKDAETEEVLGMVVQISNPSYPGDGGGRIES
jgi:hypothetical protein